MHCTEHARRNAKRIAYRYARNATYLRDVGTRDGYLYLLASSYVSRAIESGMK